MEEAQWQKLSDGQREQQMEIEAVVLRWSCFGGTPQVDNEEAQWLIMKRHVGFVTDGF